MTASLRQIVVIPDGTDHRRGTLIAGGMRAPCSLGRAGVIGQKREGDGATPAGSHRFVGLLYRPDRIRRPVTRLPVRPIAHDSGWCDDPSDRHYNRFVRLPCPVSHERLWRDDHLYDLVVVLDWNLEAPVPGRGSAIFLHLAAGAFAPTVGCVAVDAGTMRRLLYAATSRTALVVA